METEALRDVSFSIWGGPGVTDFHKMNESPHNNFKTTNGDNNSLSGRFVIDRENEGGSSESKGLRDFSTGKSWVHDKLGDG